MITTTVLALLAVGAGVLVATGTRPPDPVLQQTGHWVYNRVANSAFHIDEGTRRPDAKVDIPEAPADPLMTLQGQTQGFVVARDKVIVFGKSTLTVDSTIPVEFPEAPVGIETVGGPYLVYRETGSIVRLGVPPVTVQAGGKLDRPAYTDDGTLWVHRQDTGAICALRRDADQLDCAVSTPPNVPGSLTVATALPAFVSYPADAAELITASELGAPVPLGTDLPDPALLSDRDGGGRLAAVYPDSNRLVLTDSAGVPDGRAGGAPVTVELGPGRFGAPWQCQNVVAVLDEAANRVTTYDVAGAQLATSDLAPGSFLTRGSDCTLYVDSADGTSTHIIDSATGRVTSVSTMPDPGIPGAPPLPVSNPVPLLNPNPNPGPTPNPGCRPEQAPRNVRAEARPAPPVDNWRITWDPADGQGRPVSYRIEGAARTGPATSGVEVAVPGVPAPTFDVVATIDGQDCSTPVTPPDQPGSCTPAGVHAEVANGSALVSWSPVDGGGKGVSYRVGGLNVQPEVTTSGQSATVPVTIGLQYRFLVTAVIDGTDCADGPGESPPITAIQPASAPTGLSDSRTGCNPACFPTTATLTWSTPDLGGGTLVEFVVSLGGTVKRTPQTSAQFVGPGDFDPCQAAEFKVYAVTREPSPGGKLFTGLSAVRSFQHADCRPDADIKSAVASGNEIKVTFDVAASPDFPTTCQLVFSGTTRAIPCTGSGTYSASTGPLNYNVTYSVQVVASNKYGSRPRGATSVTTGPSPVSSLPPKPPVSSSKKPVPPPPPVSSSKKPVSPPSPVNSSKRAAPPTSTTAESEDN